MERWNFYRFMPKLNVLINFYIYYHIFNLSIHSVNSVSNGVTQLKKWTDPANPGTLTIQVDKKAGTAVYKYTP